MEEQAMTATKKRGLMARLPHYLLLAITFLIPIFVIPFNSLPTSFDKSLLITLGSLVVFLLWLGSRLVDGKINSPQTPIFKAGFFVILATLISATFSPARQASFSGFGFESWTFMALTVLFILMFLVSNYFQNASKIFKFYLSIYWSLAILFVIQIINIFSPLGFLDLSSPTSSLVGRWNDMAMFFGLGILLSVVMLEMINLEGLFKWLVRFVFGFSLIGVFIVNSSLVWWMLVITLGMFFVYRVVSYRNEQEEKSLWERIKANISFKKPFLLIILVSVFFGLFINERAPIRIIALENIVYSKIRSVATPPLEARPSWKSTFSVAQETIKTDPVLGSGPNRFSRVWRLYKPEDVNQSIFWNVDFNNSVANIPTQFITTGLLGTLAWLIFLFLLLKTILSSLFRKNTEGPLASLLVISALATTYLWLLNFIYIPQTPVVALTFIMTGIYLAVLVKTGQIELKKRDMSNSSAFGFVSVLAMILLLIASVSVSYLYINKAFARGSFEKGKEAFSSGNIDESINLLEKASRKDEIDLYYRTLVSAQLVDLSNFINANVVPTDELQAQFVNKFGIVRNNAIRSTEIDKTYFLNWLTLADVYELVGPIGVEGAYEAATNAYNKATEVAPKNPLIPLRKSRLEFSQGEESKGDEYLEEALSIKSNYTDALFLKSQRAIQNGQLEEAIQSTLQAALINPNDIGALFQLGFLYYRAKAYGQSALALERAVQINPTYANARYFLGLSYYYLGETEKAIAEIDIVYQLNPENENVLSMLQNLRSGKDPFAGEPQIPGPEESDTPPVEEEIGS